MAKKKEVRKPVCGNCMKPIDADEVAYALRYRTPYMHGCGRWIVKGRGNAEVPIANHDDLSLSDTSESEPTGD